jgi:LuxR family quorum sensing-dependent transcriptional regulator
MGTRVHGDTNGSPRATLEPLERRVLELSATGLSSSEVAEQLGIPAELVRAQLLAIMKKLGATSRLEALIIAIRRRLLDLPSG